MKKEYSFGQGRRGAVVPAPPGKSRITIRLEEEILEWFRRQVHEAGGGNYQTLINQALREQIRQSEQELEVTEEAVGVFAQSEAPNALFVSRPCPGACREKLHRMRKLL